MKSNQPFEPTDFKINAPSNVPTGEYIIPVRANISVESPFPSSFLNLKYFNLKEDDRITPYSNLTAHGYVAPLTNLTIAVLQSATAPQQFKEFWDIYGQPISIFAGGFIGGGFRKEKDVIEQNPNMELTSKENNFIKIFEQTLDIKSNILSARNEEQFDKAIKPSEPSEPSGSDFVSGFHRDLNISNTIYRLGHSDIFGCRNCKVKGDKFFMEEHACKPSKFRKDLPNLHILDLIKCKYEVLCDKDNNRYNAIPAYPAKGVLYVTEKSPDYISGEVRMRGRNGGSYLINFRS